MRRKIKIVLLLVLAVAYLGCEQKLQSSEEEISQIHESPKIQRFPAEEKFLYSVEMFEWRVGEYPPRLILCIELNGSPREIVFTLTDPSGHKHTKTFGKGAFYKDTLMIGFFRDSLLVKPGVYTIEVVDKHTNETLFFKEKIFKEPKFEITQARGKIHALAPEIAKEQGYDVMMIEINLGLHYIQGNFPIILSDYRLKSNDKFLYSGTFAGHQSVFYPEENRTLYTSAFGSIKIPFLEEIIRSKKPVTIEIIDGRERIITSGLIELEIIQKGVAGKIVGRWITPTT